VAASSRAGGPAASSEPDPDAFPASPTPVDRLEELTAQCDRYLRAQRFRATRQPEIVPGLPQFEFWLGDHIVSQDAIRTALVSAVPGMSDYPIQLAHLDAERFDLEEKQVMMLDGTLPKATPTTVAQPDGVLKRRSDGQCYWQPAPRATMAGAEPAVDTDWLRDYFEFYDLAPALPPAGPERCSFNGAEDSLDAVLRKAGEQAGLAGYRADASAAKSVAQEALGKKGNARRKGAQIAAELAAAGARKPGKANQGWQLTPGASLQYTGHWELTPLPTKTATPKSDTVAQFQFGLNNVQHPENATGEEYQGQLIVAYNLVTKKWQIMSGFQFTEVIAVWHNVQLQYFATAQGGLSTKLSEAVSFRGVLQFQTGPQLVVTFGPVQVGVQAGAGFTNSEGAPTGDASPTGLVVQVPIGVPKPKPRRDPTLDVDIEPLREMPMVDLLDALDEIRKARQLDKLIEVPPRIQIAILVLQETGRDPKRIAALVKAVNDAKLEPADRDAIRKAPLPGDHRWLRRRPDLLRVDPRVFHTSPRLPDLS
jgi:hypothetical protein